MLMASASLFVANKKKKPEQSGLCSGMVEMAGFEPASEKSFLLLSPGASADYYSPSKRPADDPVRGKAHWP